MFHSTIPAGPPNDAPSSIYALLGERARHRTREHLAMEAGIGAVGVLVLAIVRPGWWALYLPLAVVASYGAWGLVDRAAHASRTRVVRRALVGADLVLAAVGTVCVVAFFLALTRVAFQGWIH